MHTYIYMSGYISQPIEQIASSWKGILVHLVFVTVSVSVSASASASASMSVSVSVSVYVRVFV